MNSIDGQRLGSVLIEDVRVSLAARNRKLTQKIESW